MKAKAVLGGVILTAACATGPAEPDPNADVPVHGGTGRLCNAARAQSLVGRPATAELGAEAMRLTGAGMMRWLRPGDIVTMDYREDRLNVELDAAGRVKAIRCG